jgi:hypothetical protein
MRLPQNSTMQSCLGTQEPHGGSTHTRPVFSYQPAPFWISHLYYGHEPTRRNLEVAKNFFMCGGT